MTVTVGPVPQSEALCGAGPWWGAAAANPIREARKTLECILFQICASTKNLLRIVFDRL